MVGCSRRLRPEPVCVPVLLWPSARLVATVGRLLVVFSRRIEIKKRNQKYGVMYPLSF